MTNEKSIDLDKPSPKSDDMSGDEMYKLARDLRSGEPLKTELENKMTTLYGSVLDRLTPEWKAVISNLHVPHGTEEHPSYGVWEGDPTRYAPGEAWSFLRGAWRRVNSSEIGMNSRLLSVEEFNAQFAVLPPLPSDAFPKMKR